MFCMFCLVNICAYSVSVYICMYICKSKEIKAYICKSRKIKENHFVVL